MGIMEHQDELFQLVNSLSKSEKKFFTQYVNLYEKGASPIYLQVFNFLNDEPEYSEERLFKKFRDKTFQKNYPVTKHYLKNLIIKTLRHGDLTVRDDRDLTVYVLDIKRMMAKGLIPMAKRMIEKLKQEANDDEKLLDMIQLIAMQRGLISMGYYRHEPEVNLDTLDDEEDLLFEKIKQLRQLMNCSIQLYALMHHEGGTLPAEAIVQIEALGKKPYLQNYEQLLTAKAKHTFLQFWALYHCALGDYKKYYAYACRKLEFVEREKIPNTVSNWLIVGHNHYLAASLLARNFSEFETRLAYIEAMQLKSTFHDADRFQTVSMFSLLYYIYHYHEGQIRKYIAYSEQGLVTFAPFMHKSFSYTLRTTIAYAYLRINELDACLKEVNDLLALTSAETRRDYVGHVKIINLMLRYKMKEHAYLSYLIKNTYRFFVSYLYTTPVHQFVIAYLKDAMKTKGRQQLHELNTRYLNMLKELRYNPGEADMALVMMIEDFMTMDTEIEAIKKSA
jgi:hypothetical protein